MISNGKKELLHAHVCLRRLAGPQAIHVLADEPHGVGDAPFHSTAVLGRKATQVQVQPGWRSSGISRGCVWGARQHRSRLGSLLVHSGGQLKSYARAVWSGGVPYQLVMGHLALLAALTAVRPGDDAA